MTRRTFLTAGAVCGLTAGCATTGSLLPQTPARPDADGLTPFGLARSLQEEYDYVAEVEGVLPTRLRGTLYRNGPALFDRGGQRKQSILDGDGMVHAYWFDGKMVRFRNRFVRTPKYVAEQEAGRFLYATWTTRAPGGPLANILGRNLRSQAGVTVYAHHGKLFAFDDGLDAFEIQTDTLETLGPTRLGLGKGYPDTYSAHTKIDGRTGDWILMGRFGTRFHLAELTANGRLKHFREMKLPRNVYIHDFFVSERHIVLNLHPAEVALRRFVLGQEPFADAIQWHPEQGNLLYVFERGTDAPPVPLEADACWMWHSMNAYDRGSEIVADFVGYDHPDHFIGDDPCLYAVMAGRRKTFRYAGTVRRYRIDLASGNVTTETVDHASHELPLVDPRLQCHAHRFTYLVENPLKLDIAWTVVKRIDMDTGETVRYPCEPGQYCLEPVFVPRPSGGPDSGWLLSEVYDARTERTFLAVFDADSIASGPIARVHLRHHIPLNFHGHWLPI